MPRRFLQSAFNAKPISMLAATVVMLIALQPGIAEEPTVKPLHPRAITPVVQSFHRQVVCPKCDGDGTVLKQVRDREERNGVTWRVRNKEELPCKQCDGTGGTTAATREAQRQRMKTTAERFLHTLGRIDQEHQNSADRLDAAREKLGEMNCVLVRTENNFFNEWSLRSMNQTTINPGIIGCFTGTYEIVHDRTEPSDNGRFVRVSGSNMRIEFKDIIIHDATDEQEVFAGGVFVGFRTDGRGIRVAVFENGFLVRSHPDCIEQ